MMSKRTGGANVRARALTLRLYSSLRCRKRANSSAEHWSRPDAFCSCTDSSAILALLASCGCSQISLRFCSCVARATTSANRLASTSADRSSTRLGSSSNAVAARAFDICARVCVCGCAAHLQSTASARKWRRSATQTRPSCSWPSVGAARRGAPPPSAGAPSRAGGAHRLTGCVRCVALSASIVGVSCALSRRLGTAGASCHDDLVRKRRTHTRA